MVLAKLNEPENNTKDMDVMEKGKLTEVEDESN